MALQACQASSFLLQAYTSQSCWLSLPGSIAAVSPFAGCLSRVPVLPVTPPEETALWIELKVCQLMHGDGVGDGFSPHSVPELGSTNATTG